MYYFIWSVKFNILEEKSELIKILQQDSAYDDDVGSIVENKNLICFVAIILLIVYLVKRMKTITGCCNMTTF